MQFHVSPIKSVNLSRLPTLVSTFLASNPTLDLLVLPEVWNSPYATKAFPSNAEPIGSPDSPSLPSPSLSPSVHLLRSLAISHSIHIVGGSIPELGPGGEVYNTCVVYGPDGGMRAKHRKVHLFDIDVPGGVTFKESDTLTAGSNLLTTFKHPTLGVVGLGICYDIRFPEMFLLHASSSTSSRPGLDLFVLPGAFNMTTGPRHWSLLQRSRAVDTQCYVVSSSPARSTREIEEENGRLTAGMGYEGYRAWGHSMGVDPWGEIVATAGEGEENVVVDVVLERVEGFKESVPTKEQKRGDLYTVEKKE
ncbi:hypothetical protein TrRE_jg12821 [Triparma retinervis]|uniref:CN hydrolase domain-containing protein n=1 Tax=Triparma retinervis TaxID=2557542 RepID=A0A9W7A395_9STRA|nr:hypothetical protein TrRE_jg12821 [Triparma retinervis]